MTGPTLVSIEQRSSTRSILWGVLLIVLGIMAVAAPFLAAVAVSSLLAWLIMFAGCAHIMLAFHARGAGHVIWRLLVGLAYLVIGGYILWHPILGIASLTLLLVALFVAEGVLDIAAYFRVRPMQGAGWLLLDALATLFLAVLIGLHWPSSSVWAIGTLVGISMIVSGVTRVMMSLAARRIQRAMPMQRAA
jgi:uncharacterized membrane protein HdeD (DUF308 family)